MEIFHGDSKENTIRVFGEVKQIPPNCLDAKIVVWDLDKDGRPQKDDSGKIKIITITKCIESIDIEFIPARERKLRRIKAKLLAEEYLERFRKLPRLPWYGMP